MAGLTAEIPREGERYDARQRRREELVSAAWREGRADPRVANELDGFMAAASQRLGEEGMRDASRAASSGRSMTLPGVGREHQAGLNELARSFVLGRDGMALSAGWDQRVEREAKEVTCAPTSLHSTVESAVSARPILTVFFCSVKRRFSAPATILHAAARSLGQAWPKATGEAGAQRA